jgi:hypothetical protein
VHSRRDLSGRGRIAAAIFAAALLLAPALAFAWVVPDWAPAGDAGLIGIRALDVGTARTPLIGQPSTAAVYVHHEGNVNHPGATHFYLLALPVRAFGGAVGMPLVSVLIVCSSLLIAAWAVFRQLGPGVAILAAALLGLVTFTTGASSLVDPVSSSIAGYPLLCTAVLCWCLLCGDVRLLPLFAGVASFTAQQHLSLEPTAVLLVVAAVVGLALHRRRDVLRWAGYATLVAALLWLPVLIQQVISSDGNVSRVLRYAGSSDRATVGTRAAVRQIVHTLGLPPLLGRAEVSGWKLLASPSFATWSTAVVVISVVVALGLRWRRRAPRYAAMALMVGVLVLAGFVNGASVPVGLFEQGRIAFYHWAFALALFTAMVIGIALLELLRPAIRARGAVVTGANVFALAAIVVPAAINPSLDRSTNTLFAAHGFLGHREVEQLGDAVFAHRPELGAQTVLIDRGGNQYSGFRDALAFELIDRGIGVQLPVSQRGFVADGHLVRAATVDTGLVVVSGTFRGAPPEGRLLADVRPMSRIDLAAYRALIAQAGAAREVRVGDTATRALNRIGDEGRRWLISEGLAQLAKEPATVLSPAMLTFLRDHPVDEPRLDPALIGRVLESAPDGWDVNTALGLRLYLLNRRQLTAYARPGEL